MTNLLTPAVHARTGVFILAFQNPVAHCTTISSGGGSGGGGSWGGGIIIMVSLSANFKIRH